MDTKTSASRSQIPNQPGSAQSTSAGDAVLVTSLIIGAISDVLANRFYSLFFTSMPQFAFGLSLGIRFLGVYCANRVCAGQVSQTQLSIVCLASAALGSFVDEWVVSSVLSGL